MLAAEGTDVDAPISLDVVTLAGESVSVSDIPLDSLFSSLVERVAEQLNVSSSDVLLSWGELQLTGWATHRLTLNQIGLVDGLQLDCAIVPTEHYVDEECFLMRELDLDPTLAAATKNSYIEDYRLRRQTVAFAEEVADERDRQRRALKASPWTFPENNDPLADYSLRRRTVEFAENAAQSRDSRRRALKASPLTCTENGDPLAHYSLRRWTVEFAENAAQSRESRRRAIKASPLTFPENSDPLADYSLRRWTVKFAENAAQSRESRRRALKASSWTFPETSDSLAEYESRRRTVEFAVQAAAEREQRLHALLAPASDPDSVGTVAECSAMSRTPSTTGDVVDQKEISTP